MLFKKNISIQGLRILNRFAKGFFTKSFNNYYSCNNMFKINANISSKNVTLKYFSTNNNISEKESIEFIEAGVFEVLKSAQKLKHDKLNRAATLDELGMNKTFIEIIFHLLRIR